MPAPTFDSVCKAAISSQPTVAQYVKAYQLWVKVGPVDGAKAMGLSQSSFLDYAMKGSPMVDKKFRASMNVS